MCVYEREIYLFYYFKFIFVFIFFIYIYIFVCVCVCVCVQIIVCFLFYSNFLNDIFYIFSLSLCTYIIDIIDRSILSDLSCLHLSSELL